MGSELSGFEIHQEPRRATRDDLRVPIDTDALNRSAIPGLTALTELTGKGASDCAELYTVQARGHR
jgi:hypothetical protein